jgi:hypothetical protein
MLIDDSSSESEDEAGDDEEPAMDDEEATMDDKDGIDPYICMTYDVRLPLALIKYTLSLNIDSSVTPPTSPLNEQSSSKDQSSAVVDLPRDLPQYYDVSREQSPATLERQACSMSDILT